MSGQSVKLLFAKADKTVLTPVLDALREKGSFWQLFPKTSIRTRH